VATILNIVSVRVDKNMSVSDGRSSSSDEHRSYSHADFIAAARGGNSVSLKAALDQNPSYLNQIDDQFDTTALVFAAANMNHECLDVLVAAGADLTFQHKNQTALEYAVSCKCKKSVEILLKAGSSAKRLSNGSIKKYADLIKKYCPEIWKKEEDRLKFEPYSLVNEAIVIKYEGQIQGLGNISTMFNFNAQTVTEIVNDNPGTPQKFDLDNKDQITTAHDFTVYKEVDAPAPFKKVQKVKI